LIDIIQNINLNEDDDEAYVDLDGNARVNSGIFYDPDFGSGDSLEFFIWTGYKWSNLDSSGKFENINLTATLQWNNTLKLEPNTNRYGTDSISLKAVDKRGEFIVHNLSIVIAPENDPPIINNTFQWSYVSDGLIAIEDKLICFEDQWANFSVTAYDPIEPEDTKKIRFSSNASMQRIPFFNINENTGFVSFLPENQDIGIYHLKIIINDTGLVKNIDEYSFALQINNTNDPPKIDSEDIIETYEDEHYLVNYSAFDIDPSNDKLVWYLHSNASFLELNRITGSLSGTPENEDVGLYYINLSVSDQSGGFDFTNFTLKVINVNDLPEINRSIDDFFINEDTIDAHINLSQWFMDIDNRNLDFRIEHDNNIKTQVVYSGLLYIIPNADWSGNGILKAYASDGVFEINDTVYYTVKPVNDPPNNARIILQNFEYYEHKPQPAYGNASDVDLLYGDKLYYTWYSNISGNINTGQDINLSLSAGIHTVTLSVRDKSSSWTNTSLVIKILPAPKPVPKEIDERDSKGPSFNFNYLFLIIVIIIIIVVIFILMKLKQKGQPDTVQKPQIDDPVESVEEISELDRLPALPSKASAPLAQESQPLLESDLPNQDTTMEE
jgi:hypothetical protein